jgi:hypothetical protein
MNAVSPEKDSTRGETSWSEICRDPVDQNDPQSRRIHLIRVLNPKKNREYSIIHGSKKITFDILHDIPPLPSTRPAPS